MLLWPCRHETPITSRHSGPERSFVSGMRPCVIQTLPSPQNSVRFTRVLARRRALKYSAACPRASSIGLWVWDTSRSSSGG